MKSAKAVAMVSLMALPAAVAEVRSTRPCATVYVEDIHLVSLPVLQYAVRTATQIYAGIGVSLYWRYAIHPAAGTCFAIHLRFDEDIPAEFRPGALAYALPYQSGGTQIHVFVDRIMFLASQRQEGVILGHVVTHEIGHVLEQINRHSNQGVMKAHWTNADFSDMLTAPLRFAAEDVNLIHKGLAARTETAAFHRDTIADRE